MYTSYKISSNSYTIRAKKLFKKVILRMWFSIALSNVTKLNKLALNWSEDVKELSFLIFLVEVIPLSGPGFLPSFSFYNCLDSQIILCIPLMFVTNNNLIISPVSLKFKKCSQKNKKSVHTQKFKECLQKTKKSVHKQKFKKYLQKWIKCVHTQKFKKWLQNFEKWLQNIEKCLQKFEKWLQTF